MRPSLWSFVRRLGLRKGYHAWRAHEAMTQALFHSPVPPRGPQTTHGAKPGMPGYSRKPKGGKGPTVSRTSPWVDRAQGGELPAKRLH